MKKFFTPLLMLAAAATLLPGTAQAEDSTDLGSPALQYKSSRGTREKATDRYVQIYLKSSIPSTTFYIAVDDSVVPLDIVKANTLYNKKITVSKPEVTVKVYGKTINFINFNNNDAYDLQMGEDGNATINEFRCEGDSLDNLDFISNMKALTYFVSNNNMRLKDVTIKSATLQRLNLSAQPSITNLTLEAPELYELKISSAAKLKNYDLSQCSKIKTFNGYQLNSLETIKLSEKLDSLTSFSLTSTPLTSIKLANYPLLKTVGLTNNKQATSIEIKNCPSVTSISVTGSGITSLSLNGDDLPSLLTLSASSCSALTSLDLNVPTVTSITCDASGLKSVDLSKLTALKTAYFRNGVLEHITFAPEAQASSLKTVYVTNNNFALVDLPPRSTGMKPSSAYSTPYNYYAPQANPQIPQDINVGDKIDLSKYAYGQIYGTDSVAESTIKWTTIFDEDLVEGQDYKVENGVYTFLKAQDDSVRCTVTNSEFDWFKLYTDSKGTSYDYRIITNCTFVSQPTGIDGVAAEAKARVSAAEGAITVAGADGARVVIADVAGRIIWNARVADDATLAVPAKGVYVVAVGSERTKVLVK